MAKKLLEQLADVLRTKHYSYRTEETYVDWVRRFILFHNKKHPNAMGTAEIRAFLAHLATERNVAASTQNQALSAILFLYREVLQKEIEPVLVSDAKRPERLPTVLNRDEVVCVLAQLNGTHKSTPALPGTVRQDRWACRCKCGTTTVWIRAAANGMRAAAREGH